MKTNVMLILCWLIAATVHAADPPQPVKIEFRRAEAQPAEGLTEAKVGATGDTIYLHKMADATNADIAEALAAVDDQGLPVIDIAFTKAGAKKMATMSKEHQDKQVAIVVDGKVISAPVIKAVFSERARISGTFTKAEVERIVKGIQGK